MGWVITLLVLALIWVFPLGVSAMYNADGPRVRLLIGPARILVFPAKKKKVKQQIKKTGKAKTKKAKPTPEKNTGGSVKDFLPLVDLILGFLDGFRRKLRVNRLEMKLTLAGGDPCDLAVNYGRAWIAVGNLFPLLERAFVIKKRDVEVACDFASEETLIFARLDLTITFGRILSLGIWHGVRILKQFLIILNQRKGGAKNESKSS